MSVTGKGLESYGSKRQRKIKEQNVDEEPCVILAVEATKLQSVPWERK